MKVTIWTGLAIAAVLWPSRFAGALDGAPLDTAFEAILIGLFLPALWWLDRAAVTVRSTQFAIVALLAWKVLTPPLVAQQGWCVSMNAGRPLDGINQGIPIVEPTGALRSWDVRADWRDPSPRCTAIVTRPLTERREFPAWFLNVTSQLPGAQDVRMTASGHVAISSPKTLAVASRSADATLRIDGRPVAGVTAALPAGTHAVEIAMTLLGETWQFEPTLDGVPPSSSAVVTTTAPGAFDRALGAWAWVVSPILVVALAALLALQVYRALQPSATMIGAMAVSMLAAAALGLAPQLSVQRMAGLVTFIAVLVPAASHLRNLRGAMVMVGAPWLAFIAALSVGQAGAFTLYSYDDWLTYQVASHRIYFQGYWLEGGNAVFDFQPFYRWMTGALHLVFGDSSIGELYWDASCVLIGALLAFFLAKPLAGYRFAVAAAAATLATMTVGTPWYFLGRGLSEIAAAGWGFLAAFFLMRGRRGSLAWPLAAGVMAVLMFYTRLNHLLFAAFFPIFLVSSGTPMIVASVRDAVSRVKWRSAAVFAATFAAGVTLFAWRTWYYTGVFSLFHGTSLKNNDTGLRPWTLFDGDVWSRIGHSLQATVFMNEPPRPDPRAAFVVLGVLAAIAAVMQMPVARRAPAIAVIVMAGAFVGAFLAHAHGYPGRFTIHIVPLAAAVALTAVSGRARAQA